MYKALYFIVHMHTIKTTISGNNKLCLSNVVDFILKLNLNLNKYFFLFQ